MRSIRGAVTAPRQLLAHSNQRGAGAGLQLPACGRKPARPGTQALGLQPSGGLRPPCILCPGAPLSCAVCPGWGGSLHLRTWARVGGCPCGRAGVSVP